MRFPLILLCGSLIFIHACRHQSEALNEGSFNGYAQGTTFHINYLYQGEDPQGLETKIDRIFRAIDQSMSTYRENSLISRLNRGDTLSVDHHLKKVHRMSLKVHQATDGYFDPTVGPLVNYWGFGPKAQVSGDTAALDSLRQLVGIEKLAPIKELWYLPVGMQVDYNAIAQGYTVDVLADLFEEKGIKNYMIEVGGELRCLGHNIKGEAWRIGVDKPTEEIDQQDRFQFILGLDSLALATSGNYRKYWVDSISGERFAHTINPKTGAPTKNKLLSASVLAETAMEADAYATAFMSMGLKKSIRFLEKEQRNLEVYLIHSGENGQWEVYQSPGFKKRVLN